MRKEAIRDAGFIGFLFGAYLRGFIAVKIDVPHAINTVDTEKEDL